MVIKVGSTFSTLEGYAVVTHLNGSGLAYCDLHEVDGGGNTIEVNERPLTRYEIARILRDVTGRNHTVVFDY